MVRLGSSRAQCRETVGVALATLLVSACGLAAGLLISGCSSSNQTGLVNMWRDRYQNQPMSKLLIVGFQKDLAARRNWEDPFAEELRKQGVTAVPSYTLFPGDLPDTQQVVEVVGRDGYDGVVMTRPLSSTVEIKWVPGYVREVPSLQYATWSSVYHDYHRGVYEPDSVETHVLVSVRDRSVEHARAGTPRLDRDHGTDLGSAGVAGDQREDRSRAEGAGASRLALKTASPRSW